MSPACRFTFRIRGAVQGVGFRPFVHRLATAENLKGFVYNSGEGVRLEVEGLLESLERFRQRLIAELPPRAAVHSLECRTLDPVGYESFEIRPSPAGKGRAVILPDIATCPDCLREILDPRDRRFRYPFTNCTNCGPRYSILERLPYDRQNTSMKGFSMCPDCTREFRDPTDRRFHAQPNACPACGPRLELRRLNTAGVLYGDAALKSAGDALKRGEIVALKGLGGFHLLVDAFNSAAIAELRRRKNREEKPLALMFGSLAEIEEECSVSGKEAELLASPASPILLLRRRDDLAGESRVSPNVAPGNPDLGVMLPYTPLHHLLLGEMGRPLVATSGNLSDEPICIDNEEALDRLAGLADVFLLHDRPILRQLDDSVVCVTADRELILRRSRGYAPLPFDWPGELPTVLALGGHLKNTVAVSVGDWVFISQHIGDLETEIASAAFVRVIDDLTGIYGVRPREVVCDLHPDYRSSREAMRLSPEPVRVQHHLAHVLSCMAENEILSASCLGVAWDGTGFGTDRTIWGGEFFRLGEEGPGRRVERCAHFRTFPLPGGEQAVREPRRSALGMLVEAGLDESVPGGFERRELQVLCRMMKRGVNSPRTSSVGRLFDAVSSILGVRQVSRFEGQAAMELEFLLEPTPREEGYPFNVKGESDPFQVDWEPAIVALLEDLRKGTTKSDISARFHNGLAEVVTQVALRVGEEKVALSGGCFQNRYLTERTVTLLRSHGFRPYWHQRVPPNDGGIALGQIAAVAGFERGVYVSGGSRRDCQH